VKTKTIAQIISKKMKRWWDSIDDPTVKKLAEENTIVTGGCIASMLLREKLNDFDVYIRSREALLAIAQYYVKRFEVKNKAGVKIPIYVDTDTKDRIKVVVKSAGIASSEGTEKPYEYFERRADGEGGEYVEGVMTDPGAIEEANEQIQEALPEDDTHKYKPVFLSTNAISLSGKVQIVLRFYGEPEEIHKNYDFVHCTNYWTSWDRKLILNQPALTSLLEKDLKYVGSLYPVCSMFRIRKFTARGWTINAGQMLKIAMQISKLNLEDIKVLEDQLTGVDVAYFVELVAKLREKYPTKVNTAYLCEIIDRMF
jgi:hypothetical protein